MPKVFILTDPESVQETHKAAARGDVASMVTLGHLYRTGQGVHQDKHKAFKLYEQAAQFGDLIAITAVGRAYQAGDMGVLQNHRKAVEYLRRASDGGDPFAAHHLAFAYENGFGVRQDASEALTLYRQAASSDYAPAVNVLGLAYATGLFGIQKDQVQAAKLYRRVAELGDTDAMVHLAMCLELGEGVEQDLSEAIDMYIKAAEEGHDFAKVLVDGYEQNDYGTFGSLPSCN